MKFLTNLLEAWRVGLWATDSGWVKDKTQRCPDCGYRMYRRSGDFACTIELYRRYLQRSRATA